MIRQVSGPTLNPADIHPDLPAHQAEMITRCPYLRLSVEREHTVWSAYTADPGDKASMLDLLIGYAEEVRQARRSHGPLVCRNVALVGPTDTKAAQELMEIPVWLARNLYAPVQIIVDRFWIGIGRLPGRGRSPMLHVPIAYFMIRCGIAHRDRIVVSQRLDPGLAALRAGPGDDNHDVVAAVLGCRAATAAQEWLRLRMLFPLPAASRMK